MILTRNVLNNELQMTKSNLNEKLNLAVTIDRPSDRVRKKWKIEKSLINEG